MVSHKKKLTAGTLGGIAAVITAVATLWGTIFPHQQPQPTPTTPIIQTENQTQPFVCGSQLPGLTLFGKWRWSGTVDHTSKAGIITFNNDCTYRDDPSGDEGNFIVSRSPASIILTGKEKHTYLVTSIYQSSFHASSPDYAIELQFVRP